MEALKNILQKNKFLLILSLIYGFFLLLYWGRFGDIIVDCGREAYIPFAMADLGKVLFKDIICIYGPLPYYLNAFIVKLFGSSLNVMSSIGATAGYIFLLLFYFILKRFLGVLQAFFISLAILFSCVFSVHIFNYVFPYSYAILYGLVFALFSMFFVFKFIDTKKPFFLYFSAFFFALTVSAKYDFLPCVLILPLVIVYFRKEFSKKNILYTVISFFIPLLILALIPLFQGVLLSDIAFNFKMISNMAHSPSLEFFYKNETGFYFVPDKMFILLKPFLLSFLTIGALFCAAFFLSLVKNKALKYGICLIIAVFTAKAFYPVFCFFPLIIFIFFAWNSFYLLFKKRFFSLSDEDFCKYLFIFFTILFSFKTLFDLNLNVYGTFYLPCILLSFYLIFMQFFKTRLSQYFFGINFLNLVFSLAFLFYSFNVFGNYKNVPVKTPSGTIFADPVIADPANSLIKFLGENLSNGDSFLAIPEGLFFNYALKNEYKYFNTSFIPLDFEAYGEDYLTKSVLQNLPRYLIITDRDTTEYGYTYICRDYGQKFCTAVNNFYEFKARFANERAPHPFRIYVFEKRPK